MNGVFLALAFALVAGTWASLWASQRRVSATRPSPGRANLRMLDEALAALQADLARGAIDPARYGQERAEIERRLLDEVPATAGPDTAGRAPRTLAGLALLLPALAAGGYLLLGNPAALSTPATEAVTEPAVSAEDVQAMVETLAQRMRSRPPGHAEDLQGWVMLARSFAALQRFDDAAGAYERAVDLAPNDAQLLADLADVLAMRHAANGPARADARSIGLIERALRIDPRNLKALALAGSAAFERHDTAAAIDFWRRARALAPAGSDFAAGLDQNLAEAGAAPGGGVAAPASASASVHGEVRIAAAFTARVAPGDTVFIFARDADGPPMPLAVLRKTAGELPIAFTLDDSLAMSPERRLSQARRLVVGARVSRSGNALPQPGDLFGQVEAVVDGPSLSITLDRIQP